MKRAALVPASLFLLLTTACTGVPSSSDSSEDQAVTAGKCPKGTTVSGVDVSVYQGGSINWGSVKAAGQQFGIARVSDGTGYIDSTFAGNWSRMKSAGLLRGAYQFFEPGQDAVAQANVVIARVGKLGVGDLPVMLDMEVTGGQSAATITAKIHQWVNAITAGTGKKPFIYTGAYFWDDNVRSADFASYALDVAWYGTNCPGTPNAWANWTFHQYTSSGSVSGIPGRVDVDVFNGTLAQLQAFAGGSVDPCSGIADGDYCGGTHGMTGSDNTLYTCAGGKQSVNAACSICESTPGGDYCLPAQRVAQRADLDGDGKADLCARAAAGVDCWASNGSSFSAAIAGPPLSDAQGWAPSRYYTTIDFADINGDGKADVCGRGGGGIACWPSTGRGFGAQINGPALSDAQGFIAAQYNATLQWGDVTGDGKADVCVRGAAGMFCWPSTGTGFGAQITGPALSDAAGWADVKYYSSIQLVDVNGDGKADICARAAAGIDCWLSTGTGFETKAISGPPLSDAAGWGAPQYYTTIQYADVNGDGKMDVCARAAAGIDCWLSTGAGFATAAITGAALSDAQGWAHPEYYTTIQFGDVNGDGKADVCGRGNAGMYCWLSDGKSFPKQVTGPALSDAQGWAAPQYYSSIKLTDVNGDGKADFCARGIAGEFCWASKGGSFDTAGITGPALSDAASWNHPHYFMTAAWLGGAAVAAANGGDSDGGIDGEGGPVTPVQGAEDGGIPVGGGDEVGTMTEAHGCSAAGGNGAGFAVLVALAGAVALSRRGRA